MVSATVIIFSFPAPAVRSIGPCTWSSIKPVAIPSFPRPPTFLERRLRLKLQCHIYVLPGLPSGGERRTVGFLVGFVFLCAAARVWRFS